MPLSKLILFCGLPGSGKTTLAKKLEKEYGAVRLNTDEWMADLGFDPNNEEVHKKLQDRLWELAKELLKAGQDVILENGLWTRAERDDKRRDAKELGVSTELHYLNVPLEELVRRLEARNVVSEHGHAVVTKDEIEEFAKIFEAPSAEELELFTKVIIY
jgi:predicted kinase